MNFTEWVCIDAGSEYCPCDLAQTNDCVMCTHLQGKNYCECNWMGVCIYQNFCLAKDEEKNIRKPEEVKVVDYKIIGNIIVISLKVEKDILKYLNKPGAYIFIRNKQNDIFYDIPISIMDIDEEKSLITVAIEVRGIKTKKLLDNYKSVIIRGPYWNGILGLRHLKETQNKKCLIITRGIAQAPTIPVINQLIKNDNALDIIVNIRPYEHNFIREYFDEGLIKELDMNSDKVSELCIKLMEENQYDLIFIGGADSLQNKITKGLEDFPGVKIVTTNNNVICCGEGVCGSCLSTNEDGISIRTCKAQRIN